MKIIMTMDCTPEELRASLGLPDVGPMQQAVTEKMQRRLLDDIDAMSPGAVLQSWYSPAAMQQAMTKLFTSTSPAGG